MAAVCMWLFRTCGWFLSSEDFYVTQRHPRDLVVVYVLNAQISPGLCETTSERRCLTFRQLVHYRCAQRIIVEAVSGSDVA